MHIAIIGATGSCGRQVAAQLIERRLVSEDGTLHLVGHAGGAHQSELWGLRADLRDAFADRSPEIEVGTDVSVTGAELVVMMAGATLTRSTTDRAALAATNRRIFTEAAEAVGQLDDPTVVVQSNPVELAMSLFADHVPRHRLIGAAAWSDSLRFRRELAADLGVRRPMVEAQMWGQHGDHLVPVWSRVRARGVTSDHLAEVIGRAREGRSVTDLPDEIRAAKGRMLEMIEAGDVVGAYGFVQRQPPDVRAAVKPIFTHFTAGHTTELATAHAVVDLIGFLIGGTRVALPAQVILVDEVAGCTGPLAVPVVTDAFGWSGVALEPLAADEELALRNAADAVAAANA